MQSTIIAASRYNRLLTSSRRTVLYSTFTLKSHCDESLLATPGYKSESRRFLASSHSPLPSTDSSEGDDAHKQTKSTPLAPGPIFPWVSSETSLPRLAENDDFSGLGNTFRARFAKRVSVAIEMGVPIWNILITKAWEKELAHNCSWAFKMAVCGLLSRTFQVPFWQIKNTGEILQLNTIDPPTGEASIDDEPMTDEDKQASSEYVESMIEESLLQLYPKLPSLPNIETPHQINFQLKPIASRLENAFLVPSLTRDDVKSMPKLKGSYSKIEAEWKESQSMSLLRDMADELHKKTDHGGSKRSLIVDVSVDCLEIFQIRDRETGNIVQGYGFGERESEVDGSIRETTVTHLVRFEVETMKGEKPGERILGSWQIIDIDDMLNGNVWH